MADDDITPAAILALAAKIEPLLKGNPAEVVGGALADLTATWLASHVVTGDMAATRVLRADLLVMQGKVTGELVPINARRRGLPA